VTYPHRGEIYWVRLDPTLGTEIAKTRPAVIISNDIGNQYSERVIVAPITTGDLSKVHPFEVMIPAGEGGLPQTSKILLDQIRTLDKKRLGKYLGAITPERILEINRAIRISLAV